jgi:hypothetical protein
MENSLVEYVPRGWPYITIDYFRQGQIVKGKNTGIIMIYHGRTTEIRLPNLGLGLYAMNSLIVLPSSVAVGRSASTRIDQGPPTRYYGTNTAPQGPAYTAYQTFDHTGSS